MSSTVSSAGVSPETVATLAYCPAAAVPVASYSHVSSTSRNPSPLVSPPVKVGSKSSLVSPAVPASSVSVTSEMGVLPVFVTS